MRIIDTFMKKCNGLPVTDERPTARGWACPCRGPSIVNNALYAYLIRTRGLTVAPDKRLGRRALSRRRESILDDGEVQRLNGDGCPDDVTNLWAAR